MPNKAEMIGLMLAAFPASGSQGEMAAMAYLFAVDDLSDYAVTTAAKEFIRGEVKAHDKRFAPSAAMFAERAGLHEKIISGGELAASKNPALLDKPELPEEYRAEMRRRIAPLLLLNGAGGGTH